MMLALDGPLLLAGAGRMGGALLKGWLARGLKPGGVFVQEPRPSAEIAALLRQHGISAGASPALPKPPAVLVLAVKPQIMEEALPSLAALAGRNTVVLSIAAGRTLQSIEKHFPPHTAIVRAMPNLPASIGRGITVACANSAVIAAQAAACEALLAAVGEVAWVEDEALLDAVTAVSGSGPAYVFLLAECLAQAARAAGLDAALADKLARATVAGAGELLRQSEDDAAVLRENVTSPGGTTAAALEVLMGPEGLQPLMTKAVAAAASRSRQLSR